MINNNIQIIELLIEAGADVNFKAHDGRGDTRLQATADAGLVQTAKFLLQHRADPTIKVNGDIDIAETLSTVW